MYKETALLLLFLGYVSTQDVSHAYHNEHPVTSPKMTNGTKDEHLAARSYSETPTQAPDKYGPGKGRIIHALPGPVVAVIVFGVIAGIVGVILFVSFLIRLLTRKSHV
ncbi:glycophorin-A [Trichosurus vulpecula]|uniref:glycophorin-A n=1 Tax=Trichosurus vulpecula TaxID=9337 RepID=UPI00186B3BA1|nr:glycophorin-A [Trichosurus vulpecula]